MKVSEFLSKFELTNTSAEVKNKNGQVITGDSIISTGSVVTVKSVITGDTLATFKVVLFGDVTGDGVINALDFLYVKRHVWGISELADIWLVAGAVSTKNIAAVNSVTPLDFLYIKRHVWDIAKLVQPN